MIQIEQPQEKQQPTHNHAQRRAVKLEALKILKWRSKGYDSKQIARKLGWPNPTNAQEYVEDLFTFVDKNPNRPLT